METSKEAARKPEAREEEKLNGIDTRALSEMVDELKADPSKASCKFFATEVWKHGALSACKISRYELSGEEIRQDYTIPIDEPTELLGTGEAPNPQMLLYAALSSCVLNTFVVNASVRGIRLQSVEIDVEGELDLQGFLGIDESVNPGYDELTLICRVEAEGTKEQLEECLQAATRYSPNFQTITRAVPVRCRLDAR